MRPFLHRFVSLMLCIFCLIPWIPSASAQEDPELRQAEAIYGFDVLTKSENIAVDSLFDGDILNPGSTWDEAYFTLTRQEGLGSLYIIFHKAYGEYEVTNEDTGEIAIVGKTGYLHDFLDLEALFGTCPKSVTVRFASGAAHIVEVYVYTPGIVPEHVQRWEEPKDGQTDLILFSAHADDEHLFFAGILPYYGAELGCQVQVVYLTNHPNFLSLRIHELLNGLWAVGIRTYPVIGQFPDINLPTIWETYGYFQGLGHPKEDIQAFILEQIRRFKPKVVVTHDFYGEYGHGMHMVMADMVSNGVAIANDPEQFPESAEKYGTWDVPKTYIHLYKENPIILDWDQPLGAFDGMTAFQVSIKRGFAAHVSQRDDFWWFHSDKEFARDLPRYNPCFYGLYRSTVGPDTEKNDFFENLTTYEQDRQAAEALLAEQERLRAEEEARNQAEADALRQAEEAEKQKAEAQKQAEAESQAARQEEEAEKQNALARQEKRTQLLIAAVSFVFLVILVLFFRYSRRKNYPENF